MSFGPPPGTPPNHQRLYNASTPVSRRAGSQRPNSSVAVPVISALHPSRSGRSPPVDRRSPSRGAVSTLSAPRSTGAAISAQAYVADVTPTFCIDASVRCIEPINDRVAWTAEYDGAIRIRSLPKGSELKQLPGRNDTYCTCLLYMEAYQKMWAGFQDGYVRVYDAPTATLEKEIVQHTGAVHTMITLEGTVYSGGADWKICQWDPREVIFERQFYGHKGSVRCLSTYNGPTGAVLFSGSDDGTVCAWDPYAPAQMEEDVACIHAFVGHTRAVLALETVPHANQLWSGSEDCSLRVWNLESLECIATLTGHDAPVAEFLTVESRMWSADKRGHIILWDINTLAPLQDLATRIHGVYHGRVMAMKKMQPCTSWRVWTAGSRGVIQCWNAETVPVVFETSKANAGNVSSSTAVGNVASTALTRQAAGTGTHEELEQYCKALQEELAAARQDAELGFERDRMEVQRELQTQQLLEEENDSLRKRLRALEEEEEYGGEGGATEDNESAAAPSGVATSAAKTRQRVYDLEDQLRDAERKLRRMERELASQRSRQPLPQQQQQQQPQARYAREENEVSALNRSGSVKNSRSPAAGIAKAGGAIPLQRDSSEEEESAVLSVVDQDSDIAVSHHTRRFKGGNWAYLMEEKPHELQHTFRDEASEAFGVPVTQIKNIQLSLGSLVAEVDVAHPTRVSADEMARRFAKHPFKALATLHDEAYSTPKKDLDAAEQELLEANEEMSSMQDEVDRLREAFTNTGGHPEAIARDVSEARSDSKIITIASSRKGENAMEALRQDVAAKEKELVQLRDENDRLLRALERSQSQSASEKMTPAADAIVVNRTTNSASSSTFPPALTGESAPEDLARLRKENKSLKQRLSGAGDAESRCRDLAEQIEQERQAAVQQLQDAEEVKAKLAEDNEALRKQLKERKSGQEPAPTSPPIRSSVTSRAQVNRLPSVELSPSSEDGTTPGAEGSHDDYNALKHYLESKLKPTIAELEREKAERDVDLQKLAAQVDELKAQLEEAMAETDRERSAKEAMQRARSGIIDPLKPEQLVERQSSTTSVGRKAPAADVSAEINRLYAQLEAKDAQIAVLRSELEDAHRREGATPPRGRSPGAVSGAAQAEDSEVLRSELRRAKAQVDIKEAQFKKAQRELDLIRREGSPSQSIGPGSTNQLSHHESTTSDTACTTRGADAASATLAAATNEEDHEALKQYVSMQLKPQLSLQQRIIAEMEADMRTLQAEKDALVATGGAQTKTAAANVKRDPVLVAMPKRGDVALLEAVDGKEKNLTRLREDHDAIKKYVDTYVKPAASGQQRKDAESAADLERLTAENKTLRAQAQQLSEKAAAGDKNASAKVKQLEAETRKAKADVADKEMEVRELQAKISALERAIAATAATEEAQRQEDAKEAMKADLPGDYKALEKYVTERLKPQISALQRSNAEKDVQLQALQEALDDVQDADDEHRVRAEKMAEAVQAMNTALEEKSKSDQPARGGSQSTAGSQLGRATVPTLFDEDAEETRGRRSFANADAVTVEQLKAENAHLRSKVADLQKVVDKAEEVLKAVVASMSGQCKEAHNVVKLIDDQKQK